MNIKDEIEQVMASVQVVLTADGIRAELIGLLTEVDDNWNELDEFEKGYASAILELSKAFFPFLGHAAAYVAKQSGLSIEASGGP